MRISAATTVRQPPDFQNPHRENTQGRMMEMVHEDGIEPPTDRV
jgi:hypothetical protein